MRLTRRGLIAGAAALALRVPSAAADGLSLRARRILAFHPREPEQTEFGALRFRSGLELSSGHPDFGGFSGLWRGSDRLVAVSDRGHWLTARVARDGSGRLSGLTAAAIEPILDGSGRPLARTRSFDVEALAIAGGAAFVSIERRHQILRFDWARRGTAARGQPLRLPPALRRLPSNRGIEAIAVAPAGSPLAGSLVAIAERSGREDEDTIGAILAIAPGAAAGNIAVVRHDGFDITDAVFTPEGDLLLLERWYRPWRGVGCRVRRIAGGDIRPGARLDGPRLLEADLGYEIDNMEGMALHVEDGRRLLTLISDDNFSFLQRTLLLEFELPPQASQAPQATAPVLRQRASTTP